MADITAFPIPYKVATPADLGARVYVGTFTRTMSDASGAVAYTGVGFTPTSIEFHAAVDTVVEFSLGYATPAGSRCMTSDGSGAKASSADCIRVIRSSGGNEQKAVLTSMNADGFTLTWTKVGTPPGNSLVVNYIARA